MGISTDRDDYFRQLAEQLEATPFKGRGQVIGSAADLLGVSRQAVYAGLRRAGWHSDRKQRTDCGDSDISDASLQIVAGLMKESSRATGKRLMSARRAIEIAYANGCLERKISPQAAHRLMRQRGLHPDQLTQPAPHVELRSLHPNHCWQFDVSVCVLFYLDHGGMGVMDQHRFYKNKPENLRKISRARVLRYLVTDHCSGALFVRYYLAQGEDQATLFAYLMEAFHERPDQLLHGVPHILIWDAGSANKSHAIQGLLDALAVRHFPHLPGSPRAKGQVERSHDLVERDFEGGLFLLRCKDIDHLNALADTWQIAFNNSYRHRRTGHSRYGVWSKIQGDQLRLCPPVELCRELMVAKPQTRKVRGNLTINYTVQGYPAAQYGVGHIPDVRVGDQLTVTVNPYRLPSIYVVMTDEDGQRRHIECEPIARDVHGFAIDAPIIGETYKAPADTPNETRRKALEKLAYEAETEAEVAKARAEKRPAFGGKIDPYGYLAEQDKPRYIQRPGTEIHVPNPVQVQPKPWPHVRALRWLRDRLGRPVSADENTALRERFPDGIPEEQLETIAAELQQPATTVLRAVK